jgi:hypothetical protein
MGNLRDKYTDEEWEALIKEIDAERAQEVKNILTKNVCSCGKAERMEAEHYCKKCLGENPLLCT